MPEKHNARAVNPEVLTVLVEFEEHHYGAHAEFRGTRDQLIAAGLADPERLADSSFGSSGVRTFRDQFANEVTIRKRARGQFEVTMLTYRDDDRDLNDKYTRKLKWFRDYGEELDRTVADLIASISRPREARS